MEALSNLTFIDVMFSWWQFREVATINLGYDIIFWHSLFHIQDMKNFWHDF